MCACLAKVTSSHCHEASQTSTTQPDGKKAAAWFSCTAALKARWNSEDVQEHFRVFRGDGTPCTIQDILDATADDIDVLCIGETHDDPVAHQLEVFLTIEAIRAARARGLSQMIVGLEMFEADTQPVLDEYCAGLLRTQDLMQDARPWSNYHTDYRQLVEFAKDCKFQICAANAPRRYVSAVAREGRAVLDTFPASARAFLAPLPYPTPSEAYQAHFVKEMLPAQHNPDAEPASKSPDDGCPYISFKANDPKMLDPVVLWDATMAYKISQCFTKLPTEAFLVHICGSFHCQNKLGLVEMLQHYKPDLKVMVVCLYPDEDFTNFDKEAFTGKGDFVILTNDKLPRSGQH